MILAEASVVTACNHSRGDMRVARCRCCQNSQLRRRMVAAVLSNRAEAVWLLASFDKRHLVGGRKASCMMQPAQARAQPGLEDGEGVQLVDLAPGNVKSGAPQRWPSPMGGRWKGRLPLSAADQLCFRQRPKPPASRRVTGRALTALALWSGRDGQRQLRFGNTGWCSRRQLAHLDQPPARCTRRLSTGFSYFNDMHHHHWWAAHVDGPRPRDADGRLALPPTLVLIDVRDEVSGSLKPFTTKKSKTCSSTVCPDQGSSSSPPGRLQQGGYIDRASCCQPTSYLPT